MKLKPVYRWAIVRTDTNEIVFKFKMQKYKKEATKFLKLITYLAGRKFRLAHIRITEV